MLTIQSFCCIAIINAHISHLIYTYILHITPHTHIISHSPNYLHSLSLLFEQNPQINNRTHTHGTHIPHLSHIGAVGGGSSHSRVRGEANLVVDDDVDCPVGGVVGEVAEVEGLVHDALTREGSISVKEKAHSGAS